jgi:DNA topoisomerase IB
MLCGAYTLSGHDPRWIVAGGRGSGIDTQRSRRELRDAQKFLHMLRFASVLPALRAATVEDLARGRLDRDRVAASAVRLIDLGLFRIGGERYAVLDYRSITVTDKVVLPTVRALARSDNGLDTLFSYQRGGSWRILHSHDVSNYIAARADGHFTAKEFRTWNATVLMALALANAAPSRAARSRERVIAASIREVRTAGVLSWVSWLSRRRSSAVPAITARG